MDKDAILLKAFQNENELLKENINATASIPTTKFLLFTFLPSHTNIIYVYCTKSLAR